MKVFIVEERPASSSTVQVLVVLHHLSETSSCMFVKHIQYNAFACMQRASSVDILQRIRQ